MLRRYVHLLALNVREPDIVACGNQGSMRRILRTSIFLSESRGLGRLVG